MTYFKTYTKALKGYFACYITCIIAKSAIQQRYSVVTNPFYLAVNPFSLPQLISILFTYESFCRINYSKRIIVVSIPKIETSKIKKQAWERIIVVSIEIFQTTILFFEATFTKKQTSIFIFQTCKSKIVVLAHKIDVSVLLFDASIYISKALIYLFEASVPPPEGSIFLLQVSTRKINILGVRGDAWFLSPLVTNRHALR